MHRRTAHADVFLAIADPTRRAILHRLASGEHSAGQLAAPFRASQSAVSQHLGVLRDAGLVRVRSEGRQRFYTLRPAPLKRVARWVAHYERFWNERLDALGAYLDRELEEK
ncbi:MAG: metalloregulator ArsR/SmtB family transcription factor [Sandaracinus sp.]